MSDVPYIPPVEVMPRDLARWRQGSAGIDYVHTFDSGLPGPHVMVNALTHGNELCGMTALCLLLDRQVRPLRGRLTLSFANVAAYHRFDADRPFDSRFVDRDFNRVWSDALLDGPDSSEEVRRARELRPLLRQVDALLDLHSTSYPVPPMLCFATPPKARALAAALGQPPRHVVTPGGRHSGGVMFEYGRFSDPADPAVAMLVECGQHFARRSGEVAIDTMLRFLLHFGMIEPALAEAHAGPAPEEAPSVYEITDVLVAETDRFRFSRRFQGFEELALGEAIGTDGDRIVRAPYERCALIMPARLPMKGREVVTLARRL